jgi:hypothetical protein
MQWLKVGSTVQTIKSCEVRWKCAAKWLAMRNERLEACWPTKMKADLSKNCVVGLRLSRIGK